MSENNESIDEIEIKSDPKESLLERHRLEKKHLNGLSLIFGSFKKNVIIMFTIKAKITQMRHSLTKGDKKKKKEINKEIDSMTEELQKRHENELKNIESASSDQQLNDLSDQMNGIRVIENKANLSEDLEPLTNAIKYNETKISRAQKKREAKALKQKEKEQRIRDDMIDDSENIRLIEDQKIKTILNGKGLTLYEIPSDGDCMYKAIEHQLSLKNITTNVSELRQKTCDFMKDNKIDFLPFLTSSSTGDLMNDSEYEHYCNEIANTKSWGGQLELKAISHIFGLPIEVIQTEGNHVLIAPFDCKTQPLILW